MKNNTVIDQNSAKWYYKSARQEECYHEQHGKPTAF